MRSAFNVLSGLPAHLSEELYTTLLETPAFRIERIVSCGHSSPAGFWFDQERHEWVMLLQGAARLCIEGEEPSIELKPGDVIHLPAHRKHRVEWTTPDETTVWLAVHYDVEATL